jgi:uncharacterized membrane protein
MTNVMFATFKDERKAIDAYRKLTLLESQGDITLYDKILIRKLENGNYETLKGENNEGWMALGGMAVGGLIGAIGGPVGILIGLYAGTAIGAISEIDHYDFAQDFIENVEKKVESGTVSLIAEIDEEDTDFVELSLNHYGAIILKSSVEFAYDDYMNEQMDEVEDEIAEQSAKLKKSIGKEKDTIESKITALKEKRKARLEELNAKLKIEVKAYSEKAEGALDDRKTSRIKRSIARHEAKLTRLQQELKVLS